MEFVVYNYFAKEWVRVSHKAARKHHCGYAFSLFGKVFFDSYSNGTWDQEKVKKFNPLKHGLNDIKKNEYLN